MGLLLISWLEDAPIPLRYLPVDQGNQLTSHFEKRVLALPLEAWARPLVTHVAARRSCSVPEAREPDWRAEVISVTRLGLFSYLLVGAGNTQPYVCHLYRVPCLCPTHEGGGSLVASPSPTGQPLPAVRGEDSLQRWVFVCLFVFCLLIERERECMSRGKGRERISRLHAEHRAQC